MGKYAGAYVARQHGSRLLGFLIGEPRSPNATGQDTMGCWTWLCGDGNGVWNEASKKAVTAVIVLILLVMVFGSPRSLHAKGAHIHACMHEYTHGIHVCIDTCIHVCIDAHACMRARAQAYAQSERHLRIHTRIYAAHRPSCTDLRYRVDIEPHTLVQHV